MSLKVIFGSITQFKQSGEGDGVKAQQTFDVFNVKLDVCNVKLVSYSNFGMTLNIH